MYRRQITRATNAAMIARPPSTPPTMAPTGAGLEVEAAGAEEVEAAFEAAFDAVLEVVLEAGVEATGAVLGDKFDVEVANVLDGVEDGAAVDEGGFCVPVERLR